MLVLTTIPFVKAATARRLHQAGLKTVEAVAAVSDLDVLVRILSANRRCARGRCEPLQLAKSVPPDSGLAKAFAHPFFRTAQATPGQGLDSTPGHAHSAGRPAVLGAPGAGAAGRGSEGKGCAGRRGDSGRVGVIIFIHALIISFECCSREAFERGLIYSRKRRAIHGEEEEGRGETF